MDIDVSYNLELLVDCLMPELSPHETSMYLFLFRHAWMIENPTGRVRFGQRRIAQLYGRGPKNSTPSRQHIIRQVENLEGKSCIRVGDTNRDGTLYEVVVPEHVPIVIEKIATSEPALESKDYFNDPEKRREVYDRDDWTCQYCGEKLGDDNITLDHFIPQCADGTHEKENLRTACLSCNSVKSGKTYEEAAVAILESIQKRRRRDGV